MHWPGDWQKFKGLPGSEGTLKKIAEKPHKRIAYEAAVKDAMNEPADGATTMKKKAAEKLAAKAAPAPEAVADVETPTESNDVQVAAETVEAEVPASVETNATETPETPETPAEAAAE